MTNTALLLCHTPSAFGQILFLYRYVQLPKRDNHSATITVEIIGGAVDNAMGHFVENDMR
jgi:hypothetical protein